MASQVRSLFPRAAARMASQRDFACATRWGGVVWVARLVAGSVSIWVSHRRLSTATRRSDSAFGAHLSQKMDSFLEEYHKLSFSFSSLRQREQVDRSGFTPRICAHCHRK